MAVLTYAEWREVKGTFYWCRFDTNTPAEHLQIVTKWLTSHASGWSYAEEEYKQIMVAFELDSELLMFRMWLSGDPFSGSPDDA